ncbi:MULTISPECIES: hypothetical protein [Bacillus cereus group]|uniref:hypothetical protein n=1 Tax=Bacillus cereus group TaxID=86661 RepID=UPI000BF2B5FA|nr:MULTISPECIES: hypothetical protein [Bacillus cereus group]PEX85745.1 hypothetical protein CN450_16665 [Bacillus cereus]QWG87558.1 hypothetical protein EXW61_30245 [Bacillus mycoides]
MKKYIKFQETSSIDTVNRLQKDNWEVIEIKKNRCIDTHTETMHFILGYSVEEQLRKLQNIISSFEQYGFKEELFKCIANNNCENYDDIEEGKNYLGEEITPTAKFIQEYEEFVHGKQVPYYNKSKQKYSF